MNQTPVTSSNIARIGHDGNTLFIKFNSGKDYRYPGVPEVVYQHLATAESVGQTFHREVRNKFPHELLTGDPFA